MGENMINTLNVLKTERASIWEDHAVILKQINGTKPTPNPSPHEKSNFRRELYFPNISPNWINGSVESTHFSTRFDEKQSILVESPTKKVQT